MDRRRFLLCAAAMGVNPAMAEFQCGPYDAWGRQLCVAGVPSIRFIPAQQQCPQWCWAACIQMIFATSGRFVDQRAIVARLYPNLICASAAGHEIVRVVNSGGWFDSYGRRFSAYAQTLQDLQFGIANSHAAAIAAQELAAGRPLINGALGHATVLSAMQYVRDAAGNGWPTQLTVRDPWPGHQNRRTLTQQEVAGTQFLARVQVG